MQLTRAGDYGLQVVLALARAGRERYVSAQDLLRFGPIPEEFARKLLQVLARAGIVESRRGRKGGFRLARPAREVTPLAVVEAIEGPVHLNLCLVDPDACRLRESCPMYPVWCSAEVELRNKLSETDFQQLSERAAKTPCLQSSEPGTRT